MKSEQNPRKAGRRQHDRAFKEELVRQSLAPGASVSAIALRSGVKRQHAVQVAQGSSASDGRPGDSDGTVAGRG